MEQAGGGVTVELTPPDYPVFVTVYSESVTGAGASIAQL